MKIKWRKIDVRPDVSVKIAEYLRLNGYIDGYVTSRDAITLVVDKPSTTILFSAVERGAKSAGVESVEAVKSAWDHRLWNIILGGRKKAFSNDSVTFESTERHILSLRVPTNLYESVKSLAAKRKVTMTELVGTCLQEFVEKEKLSVS